METAPRDGATEGFRRREGFGTLATAGLGSPRAGAGRAPLARARPAGWTAALIALAALAAGTVRPAGSARARREPHARDRRVASARETPSRARSPPPPRWPPAVNRRYPSDFDGTAPIAKPSRRAARAGATASTPGWRTRERARREASSGCSDERSCWPSRSPARSAPRTREQRELTAPGDKWIVQHGPPRRVRLASSTLHPIRRRRSWGELRWRRDGARPRPCTPRRAELDQAPTSATAPSASRAGRVGPASRRARRRRHAAAKFIGRSAWRRPPPAAAVGVARWSSPRYARADRASRANVSAPPAGASRDT